MLRNYVKVAFRNLRKHTGYTFINVADSRHRVLCADSAVRAG